MFHFQLVDVGMMFCKITASLPILCAAPYAAVAGAWCFPACCWHPIGIGAASGIAVVLGIRVSDFVVIVAANGARGA